MFIVNAFSGMQNSTRQHIFTEISSRIVLFAPFSPQLYRYLYFYEKTTLCYHVNVLYLVYYRQLYRIVEICRQCMNKTFRISVPKFQTAPDIGWQSQFVFDMKIVNYLRSVMNIRLRGLIRSSWQLLLQIGVDNCFSSSQLRCLCGLDLLAKKSFRRCLFRVFFCSRFCRGISTIFFFFFQFANRLVLQC